ncbi:hypothetical protein JYU34_019527 [Plutella xylostella]|uniref:Uncharacterized protein n=1 Tax=Plutella xylostella TaxID=51655 RepID=A0ABQ7PYC5_PLUXY|nr:hypothetical protein JYU34_019527 [Plutella xylostella]
MSHRYHTFPQSPNPKVANSRGRSVALSRPVIRRARPSRPQLSRAPPRGTPPAPSTHSEGLGLCCIRPAVDDCGTLLLSDSAAWRACRTRRLLFHIRSLGKDCWPIALRVSSPVADRAPVSCLSLGPDAPAPAVLEVAASREPLASHLSPTAPLAI